MIGLLRGTIQHGYLVVGDETSAVGYELKAAFPLTENSIVTAHIVTVAREGKPDTLYAFATGEDKTAFLALTAITGVGPTGAVEIVRQLGAAGLARAVRHRDSKTVSAVKGIGAKTAAKIVTEIKLEGTQATGGRDIGPIVDALSSLGVDRVRARDAVVAMVEADPDVDEPTILETVLSTTGAA